MAVVHDLNLNKIFSLKSAGIFCDMCRRQKFIYEIRLLRANGHARVTFPLFFLRWLNLLMRQRDDLIARPLFNEVTF